jgi:exopolysaccharide biosynthesis glucuronosyltransferase PssE
VVVAHAGMGTIISALEVGRPILVLPRREHLGETRSDHQLATADQFARMDAVVVANDEAELIEKLDSLDVLEKKAAARCEASPELIRTIREFIGDIERSAPRRLISPSSESDGDQREVSPKRSEPTT